MSSFENSSLWQRTLAPQKGGDKYEEVRSRLRISYLTARKEADHLTKLILADCSELTIHDITHLDALWDIGDTLAGPDFELTPVEAYAFGMAVLIHDAGMTLAAYPNGLSDIKQLTDWKDSVAAAFRKNGFNKQTAEDMKSPPPEIHKQALFDLLRRLHAKQAEKLLDMSWPVPGSSQRISLLQDHALQSAYGRSIGRIASSHHWSIDKLETGLRQSAGAAPDLPGEWRLNEIKVACLLRCADAAHIDKRRAPSLLYAVKRPNGVSDAHWNFQNKIMKPTRDGNDLVYTSGEDFIKEEAASWWLCFDTIKMIDREINSANALLRDLASTSFSVNRVVGAESATVLSKQIKTRGWRPVNAEVRVSDPVHLAKTLGGKNLYGAGAIAPIRELIQNSVDAIRGRRILEERSESWGSIRVTLEKDQLDAERVWLRVDDNGLGMTERVLTGPLLDFGQSLWSSDLLRDEHPGLESSELRSIGKFGIGFYSAFLLGEHVVVATKPFRGGDHDIKVLEFVSLDHRPILKDGETKDIPTDFSTRISIALSKSHYIRSMDNNFVDDEDDFFSSSYFEYGFGTRRLGQRVHRRTIAETLFAEVLNLTACVNVAITIHDNIGNRSYVHDPDWSTSPPEKFLSELLAPVPEEVRTDVIDYCSKLLTPILDSAGRIVGRAALYYPKEMAGPSSEISDRNPMQFSFVSANGFVHKLRGGFKWGEVVGVVPGTVDNVSRSFAIADVPKSSMASWATSQAKRLLEEDRFWQHKIRAARDIALMGGDPLSLPYAFAYSGFVTYHEFKKIISSNNEILVPVRKGSGSTSFDFSPDLNLGFNYQQYKLAPNILIFNINNNSDLFTQTMEKRY